MVCVCTAPSVAPDDFTVITTTSTSIIFQWNDLVDQVNGIIRWYIIVCFANSISVMVSETCRCASTYHACVGIHSTTRNSNAM